MRGARPPAERADGANGPLPRQAGPLQKAGTSAATQEASASAAAKWLRTIASED